jgi:hypothetical protein
VRSESEQNSSDRRQVFVATGTEAVHSRSNPSRRLSKPTMFCLVTFDRIIVCISRPRLFTLREPALRHTTAAPAPANRSTAMSVAYEPEAGQGAHAPVQGVGMGPRNLGSIGWHFLRHRRIHLRDLMCQRPRRLRAIHLYKRPPFLFLGRFRGSKNRLTTTSTGRAHAFVRPNRRPPCSNVGHCHARRCEDKEAEAPGVRCAFA